MREDRLDVVLLIPALNKFHAAQWSSVTHAQPGEKWAAVSSWKYRNDSTHQPSTHPLVCRRDSQSVPGVWGKRGSLIPLRWPWCLLAEKQILLTIIIVAFIRFIFLVIYRAPGLEDGKSVDKEKSSKSCVFSALVNVTTILLCWISGGSLCRVGQLQGCGCGWRY